MNTLWSDAWRESLTVAESFLSTLLKGAVKLTVVHRELYAAEEEKGSGNSSSVSIQFRDPDQGNLLLELDSEWLPLLSSRMMGVEEHALNEVTRDLVKRFAGELVTTVRGALGQKGIDLNPEPAELIGAASFFEATKSSRILTLSLQAEGLTEEPLTVTLWVASEQLPATVDPVNEGVGEEPDRESRLSGKQSPASEENQNEMEESVEKEENEFSSMDPGEMADATQKKETSEPVISGRHVQFEEFVDEDLTPEKGARGLELLKDIEMDLSVELGRIELPLGKVLELTRGSVIELERLAGEPVDILVNGHKIAYGEVVVIDEHFGVRISNLITTRQKLVELQ